MDYQELELAIKTMTPRTKLYQLLKKSLSKRGYWKNRRRGNPQAGYDKSRFGTG